jgi:methylated-DNA-[protein]-cysteine S-methyltransferase
VTEGGAGLALFGTAIGRCGIAWTARGLAAVQLPEADDARTHARLQRRLASHAVPASTAHATCDAVPDALPEAVRVAIAAIVQLLAGEGAAHAHARLAALVLDDAGQPALYRRVHAAAREIPPGRTCTYGDLARALGDVALARAVGQAMGRNPWPIVVPCHRVLGSDGTLTGFSAHGGIATKRRMLAIEGVQLPHTPSLFGDDDRTA